jgi:hypothetical protein
MSVEAITICLVTIPALVACWRLHRRVQRLERLLLLTAQAVKSLRQYRIEVARLGPREVMFTGKGFSLRLGNVTVEPGPEQLREIGL